jgi:hypothetical protein
MSNSGSTGKVVVSPMVNLNTIGGGRGKVIIGTISPKVDIVGDLPDVIISKVEQKNGYTIIVANSTNVMASNMSMNGTYFFFKAPKMSAVKSVRSFDTKMRIRFMEDDNYVYLIHDQMIEILYVNGKYESAKPVEIFLNSANELPNRYYSDGRMYSIKKYYNSIKITFNATGLKIVPNGKVTRARLDGNIIHLDSFIMGTEKLLYSQKDISNDIIDKPKFSSSELKSYIKMENESDVSPFIYPKNVLTIDDNAVFVKIYLEDGLIKKETVDIDGLIINSEITANSVFMFGIKIKNTNRKIAAVVESTKKVSQINYAGQERLGVQHTNEAAPWEAQTMIRGVRSGEMVQFYLGTDVSLYDKSALLVVNSNGDSVTEAAIVGDTIFVKSAVSVGVKYKDRKPGIFA